MSKQVPGAIDFRHSNREVVLCDFARSPFGRFNGVLASLDAPGLGAQVINALLAKAKLDPDAVDGLYCGIGLSGAAMLTATRQLLLRSSLPQTCPSAGIDRACCSGMTAISMAARDVALGLSDVVIAGGVESLSNMPLFLPRLHDVRPGSVQLSDPLILGGAVVDRPIATYSGEEALRFGVDRQAQDQWALSSHQRYFDAKSKGLFGPEITAVTLDEGTVVREDEGPRRDSSLEKLGKLKTVYGSPTITAGNAPGLSDGAAFLIVTTPQRAKDLGLKPRARVLSYAQVAGGLTSGTSTPAVAIQRALLTIGQSIEALDRVEINEAYAATPLVSTKVLAEDDFEVLQALRIKTNPWGGAVAIGHPLGASGARLVMTLMAGFEQSNLSGESLAAASICGGFGQGDAVVLQRV
ncbi:MAG: thiolase family protein [Burkholderiaceae bacterium]|nr:thiolase family protein [Burkholderiaceae bacterium]